MKQFDNRSNPWLSIPPGDYEGHMNSDSVDQLSVLNHIFENALRDISPRSLAVLGCGTGNGFQHINSQTVERVLGVDINPEYLSILRARYGSRLSMLELSCADLNTFTYPQDAFDLIHAALIFEYVDFENLLKRVSRWLKTNGTLVTVLQLPSPVSEMISDTQFASLKKLGTIMRLINPTDFGATAASYGLKKIKDMEVPLKLGKRFLVSYHKKVS